MYLVEGELKGVGGERELTKHLPHFIVALQSNLDSCLEVFLYIEKMCNTKIVFVLANNKGITRSSKWMLNKCVIFSLEIQMDFLAVRLMKH